MKAEDWQRVKELLNAALDRNPETRNKFLDEHCAGNPEMRSEIDSLLASYEEADGFMEAPGPPSSPADARPHQAETRIGPYRVLEEIGRGGMGTVYRAVRVDDPLRRQVAVKIVKRGMDHDFILRRFRNERTILAALDHPNIAKLTDGGATEDGLPYFVMEFVEGAKTILEFCDSQRLGTRDRVEMFLLVCSAVQSAHDRRIVHRDLKPGNILIDARGRPKLLDFGIAKILDPELTTQTIDATATILRLMTPEYASPEQVRGGEITTRSDVYSLGVLLYELLTGHRPYRLKSRSPHEIAQVICEERPERPSTMIGRTELITHSDGPVTVTPDLVSRARSTPAEELRRELCRDLDNIILMAMRKEPERRYPTAAEFADDLRRYLDGRPVTAKPDTLRYRASKLVGSHRSSAIAGAVALVLGVALLLTWRDSLRSMLSIPSQPAKIIPLTSFPGDETQPAFSPDGKRLAFVWEGENGDNSDIYIKPVRGVGLERLTTNDSVDVSPTWSPDGRRIAWLRSRGNDTAVYVTSAQPGEIHQKITSLYPNRIEAIGRQLDWSPDGRTLAASDKVDQNAPFRIVLIELATGHKIQLTAPPPGIIGDSNPAFSPDGRSVACIRGISSGVDDIFITPVGGGEARRLTTDNRYIISLTWSADGRFVLFSSNRAGNHSLWRVPAAGGTPEPVGNVGESVSEPVFSRDGQTMAFSQFYTDTNIWAMNLRSLARRKLITSTQQDSSPAYSADGQKVVFRSSRGGTNEVWISNADGSGQTQVTHLSNTLSGSPKLSPDGRRIAFDSRPDGQPDIFTIDSSGSDLKRITSEPGEDVVPNWSLDGKWLYFASNRSGSWQLWKVPAEGGTARQFTKSGGFLAKESPNGDWVYYSKGRSLSGIGRIHPDGTGEEDVLDVPRPGYWAYFAVNREGLFYADRESTKGPFAVYFLAQNKLRRGRREAERIAFFDKPLVVSDQGMDASPDGKTLLYAQVDQSGSDILMVENLRGR